MIKLYCSLYGQGFFPASLEGLSGFVFEVFTGGHYPLASVGRPNPFPKVGIVFYNWHTIGI
jgi:hypothetical protein